MKDEIGIGMLGCGVVGGGVATALHDKAATVAQRTGRPLRLRRVLVRDLSRPRPVDRDLLTTNAYDVLDDPAIDVVVEVMGGEEPALEYILAAIRRGKHVVTANKEVMAKHGREVLAAAEQHGVSVSYEASVGGGIPLIGPFSFDLLANDIVEIMAIINGTTNYILTKMASERQDFQAALAEAQALGYAEADPTNDVEGYDAVYKLAILASLAFHAEVRPGDIYREGITTLSGRDFQYAAELGYAIKLLAIGRVVDDGALDLRVHPTFLPHDHILAKVEGVFNAVHVEGDLVGRILFYGRGAGAGPTASAVVADVIDTSRRIVQGSAPVARPLLGGRRPVRPIEQLDTRYYLRLAALDRPGVFAQITRVLGDEGISLASVIQKEDVHVDGGEGPYAEIVLMTHRAREADVQRAVRTLASLPPVASVGALVRVGG